jgi:hypothetical protein
MVICCFTCVSATMTAEVNMFLHIQCLSFKDSQVVYVLACVKCGSNPCARVVLGPLIDQHTCNVLCCGS